MRDVLLAGTFGAAALDAAQTTASGVAKHASLRAIAFAGWEAFGTLAVALLALACLVAPVLEHPAARALGSAVARTVAGDDSRSGVPRGAALAVAVAVGAMVSGGFVGRAASACWSGNVVVTLVVAAVSVALACGAVLAAWVSRAAGAGLRLLPEHLRARARLASPVLLVVFASAVAACGLHTLAPWPCVLTFVGGGVVAAGLWLGPPGEPVTRVLAGWRWFVAAAVLALVSAPAPLLLGRAPSSARLLVVSRAPVAGALLQAARSLVDRDHDGYSPILLGGDCDDHDPSRHPGARDVPGNGVDENCSGADAKPYVPLAQPQAPPVTGVPERPNVVFVLLDALRPDHLGFAGYARATSPNVDHFRATATWFRRAYTTAPSTRFALASLFTGLDIDLVPQQRGPGQDFKMLPGRRTVADRLGAIGYDRTGYTISYVAQHIAGVGQGFRAWETPWPIDAWFETYATSATKTTEAGLAYLSAHVEPNKPFLLFLHYRCTHDPYASDPRWTFGSRLVDRYDSAVAYCDDEVGRVLRAIDERADRDRTVVVVASDHGELLGEHGLFQHGDSLYEPAVRSLLLVRMPGLKGVPTVNVPVSLVDVAPTLLAACGLRADTPAGSWNLLPLFRDGDRSGDERRPIYLYADATVGTTRHEARGVVAGGYKYVRDLTSGATELIDLVADPDEDVDLSGAAPATRDRLSAMLDSWESERP